MFHFCSSRKSGFWTGSITSVRCFRLSCVCVCLVVEDVQRRRRQRSTSLIIAAEIRSDCICASAKRTAATFNPYRMYSGHKKKQTGIKHVWDVRILRNLHMKCCWWLVGYVCHSHMKRVLERATAPLAQIHKHSQIHSVAGRLGAFQWICVNIFKIPSLHTQRHNATTAITADYSSRCRREKMLTVRVFRYCASAIVACAHWDDGYAVHPFETMYAHRTVMHDNMDNSHNTTLPAERALLLSTKAFESAFEFICTLTSLLHASSHNHPLLCYSALGHYALAVADYYCVI